MTHAHGMGVTHSHGMGVTHAHDGIAVLWVSSNEKSCTWFWAGLMASCLCGPRIYVVHGSIL